MQHTVSLWEVQSYVETRFAELVHAPDLASVANGGLVDMAGKLRMPLGVRI